MNELFTATHMFQHMICIYSNLHTYVHIFISSEFLMKPKTIKTRTTETFTSIFFLLPQQNQVPASLLTTLVIPYSSTWVKTLYLWTSICHKLIHISSVNGAPSSDSNENISWPRFFAFFPPLHSLLF